MVAVDITMTSCCLIQYPPPSWGGFNRSGIMASKQPNDASSHQNPSDILNAFANSSAEFVSASDAARLLNLSPQRLSLLCRQGRIKDAQKIASSWIIPRKSVIEFANLTRAHGVNLKHIPTEPPPPKKTSKKKPKK